MKLAEVVETSARVRATRSRKEKTRHLARLLEGRTAGELDTLVACMTPDNREVQKEEFAACAPRIHELLNILDPDLILAMGKPAIQTLTGMRDPIDELAGQFYKTTVPGRFEEYTIPVLATYHPAQFAFMPEASEFGREKLFELHLRKALDIVMRIEEVQTNE